MAVRGANVKGIKYLEEPRGSEKGGVALISFDLNSVAYTAAADTITIGGTGFDHNVATTLTLAQMMANQRRDGKTVTLTGAANNVSPMNQAAATNGPIGFVELAAVSGGNITSMKLFSAVNGGGSELTCAASSWEVPAVIAVTYIAS